MDWIWVILDGLACVSKGSWQVGHQLVKLFLTHSVSQPSTGCPGFLLMVKAGL